EHRRATVMRIAQDERVAIELGLGEHGNPQAEVGDMETGNGHGCLLVSTFGMPKANRASLDPELRVPGDLPDVTVGVGEEPDVAAPVHFPGWTRNGGASLSRLFEERVNLVAGSDVVGNGDSGEAIDAGTEPDIAS